MGIIKAVINSGTYAFDGLWNASIIARLLVDIDDQGRRVDNDKG